MGSVRTYWHLAGGDARPTDYEIATSRLLTFTGRGLEVAVPLADWYRRHQAGSSLRCDDWERFRDPRATTYADYVARGAASEAALDRGAPARAPAPGWVDTLGALLPPALHLFHGLQMVSAYVAQMAPASRLTVVGALQAADEMRAIERLARRIAALRAGGPGGPAGPDLGRDGRRRWQSDPAWQPARRLAETLLVVADWDEAFAALNLCAKPALDAFFWRQLRELARAQGDHALAAACDALAADAAWHRDWSEALVAVALGAGGENRARLAAWAGKWNGPAADATGALGTLLGPAGAGAARNAVEEARGWQRRLGISG